MPRQPVSVESLSARQDAGTLGGAVAEPSAPPPNYWPELLDGSPDTADELVGALHTRERLDRLEREQRGQ